MVLNSNKYVGYWFSLQSADLKLFALPPTHIFMIYVCYDLCFPGKIVLPNLSELRELYE